MPTGPTATARPDPRGFSTVELALVVSVLGVIAAVAVPSFVAMTRQTRTTEAVEKLGQLYRQSVTYWSSAHEPNGLPTVAAHVFPESAALTPPNVPAGQRVVDQPGTWSGPTWQALNFSFSEPHYFSYAYDSSGSNVGAAFTARALGDLDGNGVYSTFERSGRVNQQLEVDGSEGLWIHREVE